MFRMRFTVQAQLLIVCFFVAIAHAEGGRVKVAILDGIPVYRWSGFTSVYSNDIDRELILREFHGSGFTLPEHFIDEGIQIIITRKFGGDRGKLIEALKRKGETFADFRQFTTEEIILQAMRERETKKGKNGRAPRSEAKWLASLRKDASIQILKKPSDRR